MPPIIEKYPRPVGLYGVRDPATWPPKLTVAVRTLPVTNILLQRLCAAERLTFWGEAIALILDFFAHYPALADFENLTHAPAGLICMGGAIHHMGGPVSRGVHTPLSPAALCLVTQIGADNQITRERAATVILHRNAPRAVADLCASRSAGGRHVL